MNIENEIKLDFCDVLIKPKRSTINSRSEINLLRKFKFLYSNHVLECVPIFSANMDTTGNIETAEILSKNKMITCINKNNNYKHSKNIDPNFISLSCGMDKESYEKIKHFLYDKTIKMLTIDVARGYSQKFLDTIKNIREKHPNLIIIAGNICTPEMVEAIILSGADIVKCGTGGGAVCLTRKITGVGIPQLSTIISCSDAAHGLGGHIISDGGCVEYGDLAKSFGANSDFVMLGSMLAGHDESRGEIVEINGKRYKEFYGMASKTAMNSYDNGIKVYRTAEGKKTLIPYKGSLENTVNEILGGLRSTCSYIGATHIKDMPKCTTFIRVSRQLNESLNHLEIEDNKISKKETLYDGALSNEL